MKREVCNIHFEIPLELKERMDKHLCWGVKSKILRTLLTAFLDRLDKEMAADPQQICDDIITEGRSKECQH